MMTRPLLLAGTSLAAAVCASAACNDDQPPPGVVTGGTGGSVGASTGVTSPAGSGGSGAAGTGGGGGLPTTIEGLRAAAPPVTTVADIPLEDHDLQFGATADGTVYVSTAENPNAVHRMIDPQGNVSVVTSVSVPSFGIVVDVDGMWRLEGADLTKVPGGPPTPTDQIEVDHLFFPPGHSLGVAAVGPNGASMSVLDPDPNDPGLRTVDSALIFDPVVQSFDTAEAGGTLFSTGFYSVYDNVAVQANPVVSEASEFPSFDLAQIAPNAASKTSCSRTTSSKAAMSLCSQSSRM